MKRAIRYSPAGRDAMSELAGEERANAKAIVRAFVEGGRLYPERNSSLPAHLSELRRGRTVVIVAVTDDLVIVDGAYVEDGPYGSD